MKKTIVILLIVLFVLVNIGSIYAAEKIYELTLADTTAPVGLRGAGVKFFVEEIEKHTNGKVKINVYWGESLLKAKEILKGVKEGIVDIGYTPANYYPERLFITGSLAVHPQGPLKFSNMYKAIEKCFEEIPELNQELESLNLKPIYMNIGLPMSVCSKKPITCFEDFKGKRIRASSRWYLAQLKGTGAIPVSVPWGDCYMALQTGTIDGVYTNLDGIHRTKLDEAAPNIFTTREFWIATADLYTINIDKWNSLPADIQEQLLEAGRSASLRYSELFDAEWEKVVKEQKELGYKVIAASPEDIQKWMSTQAIDQMKEDWIKEAKEKGIENAEEIVSKMSKIITEAIEKEEKEK